MRKVLQKMVVAAMELASWSGTIDSGTQFKIVDRVLARRDDFMTEKRALVNFLDVVVDELIAARREVDGESSRKEKSMKRSELIKKKCWPCP